MTGSQVQEPKLEE